MKSGTPVELVEELTVTTDAEGKFSVHVLGSDIISKDIKIKVAWKDENGNEKDVGEKACDFAEAIAKRRFPNQYDTMEPYPSGDLGWLFNQRWLGSPGSQTTAKLYLKHMKDPGEGDNDGNWAYVNGHNVVFLVDKVLLSDGSIVSGVENDDYAIVISNLSNGMAKHITQNDGAATVVLQAEDEISQANTVYVSGYDVSQWDN